MKRRQIQRNNLNVDKSYLVSLRYVLCFLVEVLEIPVQSLDLVCFSILESRFFTVFLAYYSHPVFLSLFWNLDQCFSISECRSL